MNRRLPPAAGRQELKTRRGTLHRVLLCSLIALLCAIPAAVLARDASGALPQVVRLVLSKVGPLIDQQEYGQAITLLESFQARAPRGSGLDRRGYHHPEICYTLGTCFLLQADYPRAMAALEQAVAGDPQHVRAWLNLAKAAFEAPDYPRAAAAFTEAYRQSPVKDAEHLYFAAIALLLAEESEAAVAIFDELLARHPENFRLAWRENLVHALLTTGQAERSLPHIRILAEEHHGDKQLQWQEVLLSQYLELGRRKEALAYARHLTDLAPTQPKWWQALTHLHLLEGNHRQALTTLLLRSYLVTLSAEETRLLADLHLQLGIPAGAVDLYRQLVVDGQSPALSHLIVALRQLGQDEEALATLDRYAAKAKNIELLSHRADLLYRLGRFAEAVEAYQRVAAESKEGAGEQERAREMAVYAQLQFEADRTTN